MTWTREKPKEPGYYWMIEQGRKEPPRIVLFESIPVFWSTITASGEIDKRRYHGPIAPPPLPEEAP